MDKIAGVYNVAKFLGCHHTTIYKRIKAGDFPAPVMELPLEKRIMKIWKREDLENFRDKMREVGNPNLKNL